MLPAGVRWFRSKYGPTSLAALAVWACLAASAPAADAVSRALATLADVGPNGKGAAAAREASATLAALPSAELPRILPGLDTPNVLAANWCRAAYETIVARELARPKPEFPREALRDFVRDGARQGRARRLVLRLLDQLEPEFSRELVPTLLDDPEFRSDAVAHALAAGDAALAAGKANEAKATFRSAFDYARDSAQVLAAADKLQGLGETVDPVAHLGFVVDWRLLGPFDAPAYSGFERTFPPEAGVDLAAEYAGQNGKTIRWMPHRAQDRLGQLDLNSALGATREAAAYAYATVESPREQTVQLRCGADDNCTVWLNGEKVLARRQWLNGTRMDRFVVDVSLRKGANALLVKICQGPQHKDPEVPNNWSLQLRFCDAHGAGVGLETLASTAEEAKP